MSSGILTLLGFEFYLANIPDIAIQHLTQANQHFQRHIFVAAKFSKRARADMRVVADIGFAYLAVY
jgi:hypothetical protein